MKYGVLTSQIWLTMNFRIIKDLDINLIIIDKFSKYTWGIPFKIKKVKKTNERSNILTTSKLKPLKKESDRGAEFCNSVLQFF